MSDDQELLRILEAQGRQFLQSFSIPHALSGGKEKGSAPRDDAVDGDDSNEEWGGIGHSSPSDGGSSEGENDGSGMAHISL